MSNLNSERLSELRKERELVGRRSVVELLHANEDDIARMITFSSTRLIALAHAICGTDGTGCLQAKFLFVYVVLERSVKNQNHH